MSTVIEPVMTPELHIATICDEFVNDATGKYMKGQREHGGELWKKPIFPEIRAEAIDFVNYVYTLGGKTFRCPCGCGAKFTLEELEEAQ